MYCISIFKKKKKIQLAFKNKNLQVSPLLYTDIKLRRAFLYLPRVPLLLHISLTIVFHTLYKQASYICALNQFTSYIVFVQMPLSKDKQWESHINIKEIKLKNVRHPSITFHKIWVNLSEIVVKMLWAKKNTWSPSMGHSPSPQVYSNKLKMAQSFLHGSPAQWCSVWQALLTFDL